MRVKDLRQPDCELEFCAEALETRERPRSLADIGFQIFVQRGAAGDELRVGHRVLETVFEPLSGSNRIVRDPHAAVRSRGSAAKRGRFFDQERGKLAPRRSQSRGTSARTRSDHNDVERFRHVIAKATRISAPAFVGRYILRFMSLASFANTSSSNLISSANAVGSRLMT